MEVSGNQKPYNLEAERYILGSIMLDSGALTQTIERLAPDDFFAEQHRLILSAALALFDDNKPVDVLMVGNALGDKLQTVGGAVYISELVANVYTTQNVGYYIGIVEEKALLRRLIEATEVIQRNAYEQKEKPSQIIDDAEQRIFKIIQGRSKNEILPIRAIIPDSIRALEKLRQQSKEVVGVPTGFSLLDKKTAGLQKSDLILIAARPAMGKTSFALNIAQNASMKHDIPVAIFSLEMSKEQLVNRIIWSDARVESNRLRTGDIRIEDTKKIAHTIGKLAKAKIYIDDTANITVTSIRAKCRRLKLENRLGLIVIDYLQLMEAPDMKHTENRQQTISALSRSLKMLAKELDVPVVTLSQLSRASEKREDKRPQLSDLRESGAIEQDADIVMFLYREDYYKKETDKKNITEVIIAKHRNGETGFVELGWKGEFTTFEDINRVHSE